MIHQGGKTGIDFIEKGGKLFIEMDGKLVQVRRVLGHTHPYPTGASDGDREAIKLLKQTRSRIYEINGARDGENFTPTKPQ